MSDLNVALIIEAIDKAMVHPRVGGGTRLPERSGLAVNLQGDAGHQHPAPLAHPSRGGEFVPDAALPPASMQASGGASTGVKWSQFPSSGGVPARAGWSFDNLCVCAILYPAMVPGGLHAIPGPGVPPDAAGDGPQYRQARQPHTAGPSGMMPAATRAGVEARGRQALILLCSRILPTSDTGGLIPDA